MKKEKVFLAIFLVSRLTALDKKCSNKSNNFHTRHHRPLGCGIEMDSCRCNVHAKNAALFEKKKFVFPRERKWKREIVLKKRERKMQGRRGTEKSKDTHKEKEKCKQEIGARERKIDKERENERKNNTYLSPKQAGPHYIE